MTAVSREQIKLVDGLSELEILNLAFGSAVNHVVHRLQTETVREIRSSILMSQKPETFLDFPIATTLRPSSVCGETEKSLTVFERSFSKLEDKEPLLLEIKDLFTNGSLNRSLKDDVVLAADEFICNALFNAPQPEGKNHNSLDKILKDARTATRPGVLKIGMHGGFMALSCEDQYGSLQPLHLLDKVHQCLKNGPGEAINLSDRGTAGIGSFMIFSACTSMFMSVKVGMKSQLCAVFPLIESARARSLKPKNLHWNLV